MFRSGALGHAICTARHFACDYRLAAKLPDANFAYEVAAMEIQNTPDRCSTSSFLEQQEEHILRCLGAAVVLRWDQWPQDVQKEVFDLAGSVGPLADATELRARIARFLHTYGNPGPEDPSSITRGRAQSRASYTALERWDDEGGAPQRIQAQ